jgi:nucleotide-binding universal stress UspA family protein
VASAAEQRVIVGLNGPDADSRVVRTALEIARALDTVLYAVDVQPRRDELTGKGRGVPRMQDAYFALTNAGGLPDDVDVRIVVVSGDPSEQLVQLANRPTDLLVVERGDHHDGEQNEIAWNCISNAGCPVVVVPSHPSTSEYGDTSSRVVSQLRADRTEWQRRPTARRSIRTR